MQRVSIEPLLNRVVVEHLVPDHSGERLSLHQLGVRINDFVLNLSVKILGLATACLEDGVEACEGLAVFGRPGRR